MDSKKKKKPPIKKEEVKQEEPTKEVVEVPFVCTCVGQKMRPAGAGFIGVVKSQKYVPSLGMLLVYFDNGYVVNSQICKIIKEKE